MHKIKEMLMKELKEYEKKEKLSAGDLETIHKLTDTVKNIDKIEMLEGGEGYSEDGMSYDGGSWEARGSYDGGYSERRRRRDSMGRYARDDGYSEEGGSYRGGSSRGGSYRGSSYDGGSEHLMRKMREMMESAGSDKEREALQRCIKELERA